MRDFIVGKQYHIVAGSGKCVAKYTGEVVEIESEGIWLTEDYITEEFVAFADMQEAKQVKSA